MGLVVPDILEIETLNAILGPVLTLRLYSNNKVPAAGDSAASYTEVAGGGYASLPLLFGTWSITAGSPSTGQYTLQQWTFTGVTNAPGTIYGYYVIRNSDGKLMWAERFPAASLPFSPVAGSIIRIIPKFTVGSQF